MIVDIETLEFPSWAMKKTNRIFDDRGLAHDLLAVSCNSKDKLSVNILKRDMGLKAISFLSQLRLPTTSRSQIGLKKWPSCHSPWHHSSSYKHQW